tara:strand:- start:264 stop:515 length:252 start_codon:yes stop_codon:yes gene_type:complete
MSLSQDNQSSANDIENEHEGNNPSNKSSLDIDKNQDLSADYNFGWNIYSEITNGRFAMIGFLSILIIEIISKKSFFAWAGILN